MSALPQPAELDAARERILRWRAGGPALFASEALGIPSEWDPERREGVLPWQWEASHLLVSRRRLSVRSGHSVGKSAFLSWCILWFHTCYFPAKGGCTAPTATQMSDVLWAELSLWHRRLKEKAPALGDKFTWKADQFEMVEAPQESFSVARTARPEKPEALQGLHSKYVLILVDEAPGVAESIFEAARGALASEGSFVVMTGNPTRLEGLFYETHNKLKPLWGTLQVNGEDCPLQSQLFRDELAHQYGRESNVYRVRVQGEFPLEETDSVIPMHLCEAAAVREVKPFGPVVWGVDVARFGSDRTVLSSRVTNATTSLHKSWSGMDTMQSAGKVYAEWKDTPPELRPHTIFVDVIGIGAGVLDRLLELDLPAVGVNVAEATSIDDRYSRLRDELWFRARRWLERKDCKLFKDDVLVAELSMPKYSFTSTGKIKVESKDEMKKRYPRSPDVADAFCLTFGDSADYKGARSYDPPYYEDF